MPRHGPSRSTTIAGATTANSGTRSIAPTNKPMSPRASIACTSSHASSSAGRRLTDARSASPAVVLRSAYHPLIAYATEPATTDNTTPDTTNKATVVKLTSTRGEDVDDAALSAPGKPLSLRVSRWSHDVSS